jgi:C1A family cysteine protease
MRRHSPRIGGTSWVQLLAAIWALVIAGQAWAGAAEMPTLEEVRQRIADNGYSWIADHTSVSGLSAEELQSLLGARVPEDYPARLAEIRKRAPAYSPLTLPSRFDWTDSSGVSPVRRQLCGDCWAQCSVAALESKMRVFDGDNTRCSVQQAVDCNFGNSSCSGGWMSDTYTLHEVVGAVSRSCYPYLGSDGPCEQDTCDIMTMIDGWEYIDTDVTSIKTHLMTNGPIASGMTVYSDFHYYSGGCYEHTGTTAVNHGVLIVGWDDSMCSGNGAWHIKNSWGTGWGEAGYGWLKYGTCSIGEGVAILHYTPREPVLLVYESHTIDDSAGDNDGKPDPGETVTLPVAIKNKRWETATNVSASVMTTTTGVTLLTASATFPDVPSEATQQSDSPHFSFSVDGSVLCGKRIRLVISITSDQGLSTDEFDMLIGDAETVFFDDAETDLGWSLGLPDDDAILGKWNRINPRGSLLDYSILIQPELDHTPATGYLAFVTGNAKRSFPHSFGDVDGGRTTLVTPVIDLNGYASALVRYWRWYTNDTGDSTDDYWVVEASGDSGTSWASLENEPSGGLEWVSKEFDLGSYIPLTDKVKMRFVASDYGGESVVEAIVDDFEVTGCPYWVDTAGPSVEVGWPNGGEEVVEESSVDITWSAGDDYGIRESALFASYNGGATFDDTLGLAGAFDSSFAWQVPSGEYHNCRIRIVATDRGYNTAVDESDSSFSIIRDISGVEDRVAGRLPEEVDLIGSECNPFTGSTHIFFALPHRTEVTVRVFDVGGRLTKTLLAGVRGAGYHSTLWDGRCDRGSPVSPGVYFVRLEADGTAKSVKVVRAR